MFLRPSGADTHLFGQKKGIRKTIRSVEVLSPHVRRVSGTSRVGVTNEKKKDIAHNRTQENNNEEKKTTTRFRVISAHR